MIREAFLYLWRDTKNKMYYLGVHKHKDGDDYAHSSSVMESFTYSTRPSYMKRRILAWGTWDDMFELESKILGIKSKLDRYYNVNKTPNTQKAGKLGGLANKGKKKTVEHAKKISKSNKGQDSHWSDGDIEQKKNNLTNSMKGNTNSKNHNTEKYSKTQSEAMKKAWERRKNKEKTFNHNFW